MATTVGLISLGCSKNRVDSEQMLAVLKEHGYQIVSDPSRAEVIIVNTCGFIQSAKEEAISTLFEMAGYKQTGCCRLLVATGCFAQRYPEAIREEMPEVDAIMGVNDYQKLDQAIQEAAKAPTQTLRMALVVIIVLPIACAYPFFQRYIVAGLTVGSVKG